MKFISRILSILVASSILVGCYEDSIPVITLPAPQVVHSVTEYPFPVPQVTGVPTIQIANTEIPPVVIDDDPVLLAQTLYGERLVTRIKIPSIYVDAPITVVGWNVESMLSEDLETGWEDPRASVGWVLSSALPDDHTGNMILYGHNNIYSSIFMHLSELVPGDTVVLVTGQSEFSYLVDQVNLLPIEESEDGTQDMRYLKQTRAPRLTLISCYPPEGNTYRVVVVAYPDGDMVEDNH